MADTPNPIIFRLDEYFRQKLEERAAADGGSINLLAQKIVIEALDGAHHLAQIQDLLTALKEQNGKIENRLSMIEAEVSEARKELAVSAETILIVGGKLTPEEAREWVVDNLES